MSIRTLRTIALTAVAAATAAVGAATPAQAAAHGTGRPFHAWLDGAFVVIPCPPDVPAGRVCVTDHVTGTASHLGAVSGDFLVVFDFSHPDANGNVPISKGGSLRAANGAALDAEGHGTYYPATGVVQYTYAFSGGTGRFADANGSGTWLVPPASTFDPATGQGTGPETLDGTISY
jgi:hypothetical protein